MVRSPAIAGAEAPADVRPGTERADRRSSAPWVLVAGGFHRSGAMDKANLALALCLADHQVPVHLVTHRVAPDLSWRSGIAVHLVRRPAASFALGEWALERRARALASALSARWPATRLLANGGNCRGADVNWVHSVHHAWPGVDREAPAWFRVKNRIVKASARRRELAAIGGARVVLANSEKTRRDLIVHLRIDPERVHTVYLGAEPGWAPATPAERAAARRALGQPDDRPLVAFVGTLGHDRNKGFDTLWRAWLALDAGGWDAGLLVAGGGSALDRWQVEVDNAGLGDRVRLLGFTDRVFELLAAADLLVSPARYEAYGLNVQEAICRGLPAIVSANAGVVERYPTALRTMVLPDPEDADRLAAMIRQWRGQMDYWRRQFFPLGRALRQHTWRDMAEQIIEIAESGRPQAATSALPVHEP